MISQTRRLWLAGAVGSIGLLSLLVSAIASPGPEVSAALLPTPAPSVEVAATPTPGPSPTTTPAVEVVPGYPASDGLFQVPRLGMSVPLLEMPVSDGVVNPPTGTDAYVVSGYGAPRGVGTTYVAMHSGRPDAVGNFLIDVAAGASTVQVGDAVSVDGVPYVVSEVRSVDKPALVAQPELWVQTDGRLIVFTCLQRESGPSRQNVVIIAERES